jgi:tRNA-splicing ligase RtcB
MELTVIERPTSPLRTFESEVAPADACALAQLESGVRSLDLAAPAVVLPDFHHKSKMEMPSSIAVASRSSILPTLTSSSVNCGMALVRLDCDRPSEAAIAEFYRRIKERYPYPPGWRREITHDEVVRCALEGAHFAADRWEIDATELLGIEEGGRLDLEPYGGIERARRELPWLLVELSRLRFGTIGPSNHFVELQVVEEILDPRRAELLGIAPGQVTLQYHAGGGALTGALGRLYVRRKDFPRLHRAIMAIQKPLHHLATARSWSQLRTRLALYFSRQCPPIPLDSDEGRRLMLANAAAMNYGFAFRLTTYSFLRQVAAEVFGTGSRLLVDSPHNSIYEEDVDGQRAVVHRHNSCRAFPAERMRHHPIFGITGQPLLLPGTNRTSSYLCVADSESQLSLYSACHGAGTMIADFAARGLSRSDPAGRTTLRFRYDSEDPEVVTHLDDRGVDEALRILTSHRLVRPVARMRPFAVLT